MNSRFPHRLSTGFDKKLIGVPVFPGPAVSPAHHASHGNSQALPQENDYLSQPQDDHANHHSIHVNSNSASYWKLRHVDFMPAQIKSKKDDDYEKFSTLIEKANQWSIDNPQGLIFSCETVTWFAVDKQVFTDSGVMAKSMSSDKRSKVVRGLRVWYFIYDEHFFDKSNNPGPFKLGYVNYTFEPKSEPLFSTLLSKVNSDAFKRNFSGKIVRLETLDLLADISDPDTCFWQEQPEKSRDYTSFIRILCTYKKEGTEDSKLGDITVRDFIPNLDNRTPHSQGYETYSDLWRKASRYLYSNPKLKFINAQSVFVKVKKDTDTQSLELWDRCTRCEHGSAHGTLSGQGQKTEYLQILRIVFYQTNSSSPAGRGQEFQGDFGKKFFYKFFAPVPMKRPSLGTGGDDQESSSSSAENVYEDLRQLEDKINSWIVFSGAKVAGVETINTRLASGGQEMFGPEATFVYNLREKNLSKEPWRVNIRLILEGDFKEVPVVWRNSIMEQTINSNSAIGGGFTSWE